MEKKQGNPAVVVVTTTSGEEEARAIARAAVEQKLAACVHIDRISSVYFWEGAVQEEAEFRLAFKTTSATADELMKMIGVMHSYDVPALYCLPVTGGSESYLEWVRENTEGGRRGGSG